MCTYNSLLHALRRAFPQYVVKQQNYVIGIQGSINEQQWRQQLTELGMNSHQQKKTIRNASQRALEVHTQYLAHLRSKVTMVDRGGHETPGHTVGTSIYIYTIYFMLHITHVNTHTHTHTLLSLLLLDKEFGASIDAKGLVPVSNFIGCRLECNPTS